MFGKIAVTVFCALAMQLTWAAGKVESVVGSAQSISAKGTSALATNQVVDAGTTITTGEGGRAVVRFDDGHVIALAEKSEFKIDSYRYDPARPEAGSMVFSMVKGALRSLTGLIGQRNRDAFALRVPQATIGIRGTDFMVGLVNPAYLSVLSGGIGVTNAAGSAAFAAGATATVASTTALAVAIPAAAIPAAMAATFSQLSGLSLAAAAGAGSGASGAAGGASTGAATTAGAAAGGIGTAGMIGIAAGVAVVGAAVSSSDDDATTTASHH